MVAATLDKASAAVAEYWQVSETEYFADGQNSVSNSDLSCFNESPALYKGRVLEKRGGNWAFKVTAPMIFGTAIHHIIFDTQKPTIIPADVLGKNGAKSTNDWRKFEADHPGELLLKIDEYETVGCIRDNIEKHPIANNLIFGKWGWDKVEQPVRWTCAETGMLRRSKLDRLVPDVIVDLKSFGKIPTADNWAMQVARLGYARQAVFYQDATEALGLGRLPFVFVVVQTEPPYLCETFDLEESWLELAANEIRNDLRNLKAAKESGDFRSKTHGKITTITAPRFVIYESEYSAS